VAQERVLIQAQPINNYTTVEVPVTANGLSRIAIPDQLMLKSYPGHQVVIKAIELISVKVLTRAMLNAMANAPLAEVVKAALVLYCEGWEKVQYLPLARLNPVHDSDATAATTFPFIEQAQTFENLKSVDWTKSYVQYGNGAVSANSSYAFVLGIQYMILNEQGSEIKP
jgi:hypothetical protein